MDIDTHTICRLPCSTSTVPHLPKGKHPTKQTIGPDFFLHDCINLHCPRIIWSRSEYDVLNRTTIYAYLYIFSYMCISTSFQRALFLFPKFTELHPLHNEFSDASYNIIGLTCLSTRSFFPSERSIKGKLCCWCSLRDW